MAQHFAPIPPENPNGNRLELPALPYADRRSLLRGLQASLFCDTSRLFSTEIHSHTQAQLSFHFEGAICTLRRRSPTGEWREKRLIGRQFYCVWPHELHATRWDAEAMLVEVYLEPEFLAGLSPHSINKAFPSHMSPMIAHDRILWLLASTLRTLCQERDPPDMILLETLMLSLGRRFLSLHGKKRVVSHERSRLSPERFKLVLDHIASNLGRSIRVAHLAKLVSLGTAHFTEVFRNAAYAAPMQYIRESRLIKAHEMAFSCEYRFGEIADACGFADGSHLNREFKKFFGYSARLLRYRWTRASDSEKTSVDSVAHD